MLTWQTDPLLVGPTPVLWSQWITANRLLTEKSLQQTPRLFLRDFNLNFYGKGRGFSLRRTPEWGVA
jgi:hypothetical protein